VFWSGGNLPPPSPMQRRPLGRHNALTVIVAAAICRHNGGADATTANGGQLNVMLYNFPAPLRLTTQKV